MIHVHAMAGCTPTPLAHYLKALGILRLVSEQVDDTARGFWKDECFHLVTKLDRPALLTFFLQQYSPTPAFNPWGGRSGYYSGSSEKSAREALHEIERTSDHRFSAFRESIAAVRACIGPAKPETHVDTQRMVMNIRASVPKVAVDWLDACTAVLGDQWEGALAPARGRRSKKTPEKVELVGAASKLKPGLQHPPILGTGGNEGSGSYTSAHMTAVVQCLIKHNCDGPLEGALFGGCPAPSSRWTGSFGQFLPEGVGTPWDLLLAFDGVALVRSALVTKAQQSEPEARRWLSSPFFVAPRASAYVSASSFDEVVMNKGKSMPGRGEQWFPLWSRPASLSEVVALFGEGRLATRSGRARDGMSAARAAASLGVCRGVSGFVRYGYQQRNNLATHFAVPLGRFSVSELPAAHSSLLDDLDGARGWRSRLAREARQKEAPTRLRLAERRLSDALFGVVQHPSESSRWQHVLLQLADVEAVMVSGSGFAAGPVPRLDAGWFDAADDGSPEIRLAAAFALQGLQQERRWDGVRRHVLPLDGPRFATSEKRLAKRSDVVLSGRDALADAIALVERRLVEGARGGSRHLALEATRGADAATGDLAALLAGAVDVDRTLRLARALMALDRRQWLRLKRSLRGPSGAPDDAWIVIRLATLPWELETGIDPGTDPAIVRRLAAGDPGGAFAVARRRLEAAGLRPVVRECAVEPARGRLWAAALAFPISRRTARALASRIEPPKKGLPS